MLAMLNRPTLSITLGDVENNVNLHTKANSPAFACTAIIKNTASKGSTSISTPALRTGTGWISGSYVHLVNTATITGCAGTTAGSTGANGSGGGGGTGGNPATTGSSGGAGSAGGTGSVGGTAFLPDVVAGVKIIVNNTSGTITGGTGGAGGTGGSGGGGGGGGGAHG